MARATVRVYPRPGGTWHDKARLHVVGQLVVLAGSYETDLSVGDLLLVSAEYRDISAIASDLSATAGSAYSNNANDRSPKRLDRLTSISGSIDVTASASVVGVGTKFLSEVSLGDLLVIGTATAGEARRIVAITDNLNLTVDSAFTDLANDASPQICKLNGLNGRPDFTVIRGEIDPAASTTITGINTKFLGEGIPFDMSGAGVFSRTAPTWMEINSLRSGLIYQLGFAETFKDLTGTVDTAASATVPGVGTLFKSELVIGDEILIGIERRFVIDIASDTSLTVHRAHTDQANDVTPQKIVRDPKLFDMRLQVRGLPVLGGQAAVGTRALYTATPGTTFDLQKEEATNAFVRFGHLQTAAVPNIIVDDFIEFHAIFPYNN